MSKAEDIAKKFWWRYTELAPEFGLEPNPWESLQYPQRQHLAAVFASLLIERVIDSMELGKYVKNFDPPIPVLHDLVVQHNLTATGPITGWGFDQDGNQILGWEPMVENLNSAAFPALGEDIKVSRVVIIG